MQKTILITGATDGIGYETARMLAIKGHNILLHGRNLEKLQKMMEEFSNFPAVGNLEIFVADLSSLDDVDIMAKAIKEKYNRLDILINNAGVYKVANPISKYGIDVRFIVNTIAPYFLTKILLPLFDNDGRIINLSSAAQASVNLDALIGNAGLSDGEAYAESKLAITMWSNYLANKFENDGPTFIAVNPGSLLGSKMVKKAFNIKGGDIAIGAEIVSKAALDDEFKDASGKYFDNDSGRFSDPHSDALDPRKNQKIMEVIEDIILKKCGH